MGIEQTIDLELVKNKGSQAEKRWVSTNYRFGFTKEIKGNEAEKSWGLIKL